MRSKFGLLIAGIAGVLVLGAWGGTSGKAAAGPSGTLQYATDIQLDNWNPLVKSGQTFTAIPYEGLVKVARDGFTIQPLLATSWKVAPRQVSLTLRSGVVFHDGTPFNGEAVKKNIEFIKKSGTQWAAVFANVSDVIVKDKTHIVMRLSRPMPTLMANLASRGAYMLSPKEIADGSVDSEDGTGPWVYDADASQLGSKEIFHYFPKYWAPKSVGVKDITIYSIQDPSTILNLLTTGQLQAAQITGPLAQAAQAAGLKVVATPTLLQHVLFLDRQDTFANENVRKAICYAVDPASWVNAGLNGFGKLVGQRFSKGMPGYNPGITGYKPNLDLGKRFLAKAGNPKISFTLPTYARNKPIATLFADQLGKIGIDVKLQEMTTGQYFSYYQSNKYPLQINTSATENTGPFDYFMFRFAPNGTGNPFHVSDKGLNAIANRAIKQPTEEARNKGWQAMTQYINNHALDCGYFEQDTVFAYNTKKLKDLPTTVMRPSALRYDEVRLIG